ncbi:MAG: hypothetical protein WKF30_09230 [Pyrinomonadaceae bacterium]
MRDDAGDFISRAGRERWLHQKLKARALARQALNKSPGDESGKAG